MENVPRREWNRRKPLSCSHRAVGGRCLAVISMNEKNGVKMVRMERRAWSSWLVFGMVIVCLAIIVGLPKVAHAATSSEEVGKVANDYVQRVSLMQSNVSGSGDCSWDPNLHCFSDMPSPDDALFLGYANGMFDEFYGGEFYDSDEDSDHVPRTLLEDRLAQWFTSVPDLRERIPYPFLSSVRYAPEEDALIYPHGGGKGLTSLTTEMLLYSEVSVDTYDVYIKVVKDRWAQASALSDPAQYVVHRLRIQRNGDTWRYLSFELLDHDSAGTSPIGVKGDSGVSIRSDWRDVEGLVSLIANKLDKTAYDAKFTTISSLLAAFDIDLKIDGNEVHAGFGTLKIGFPVGRQNDGYWIIVHHLHENGDVTKHRVVAKDGFATLEVTDLSSFALEKGPRATSGSASSGSSDSVTIGAGYALDYIEAPVDGTATMTSPKTGQAESTGAIVTSGGPAKATFLVVLIALAAVPLRRFRVVEDRSR